VTSNTAQDLFEVRLGARDWLLPAFPPFLLAIEPTRVIVDVHDELLPER
jgi:16S rRNA processing protein RimM